jgi:hypothetical protein
MTRAPGDVGEVVGGFCLFDVGAPVVVAAEVPVFEIPEVSASDVVVSAIFPVVAASGVLVDEEPEVTGSEGVCVVNKLLFDAVVPAARVPVDEELEGGAPESAPDGVVSDVVPVVSVPEELVSGFVALDEVVPVELCPKLVGSEIGPVVGDPEVVGID